MTHAKILAALAVGLAFILATPHVDAHKPSDSYLSLKVSGSDITGQWDIALRDLDFAIGLDGNGDGDITWGEVRARHTDIAAYAQARLNVRALDAGAAEGHACTMQIGAQAIDGHTDGAYTVMPLQFKCPAS